jgi:hypothetical protein
MGRKYFPLVEPQFVLFQDGTKSTEKIGLLSEQRKVEFDYARESAILFPKIPI